VDFSADEEEKDSIGRNDEKAWNEEGHETRKVIRDPALLVSNGSKGTIFLSRSDTNNQASR